MDDMAIWPYDNMAFILAYMGVYEHCNLVKIKLIRPSCEKWEQDSPEGIISFVFFENSFLNTKYVWILSNMP